MFDYAIERSAAPFIVGSMIIDYIYFYADLLNENNVVILKLRNFQQS